MLWQKNQTLGDLASLLISTSTKMSPVKAGSLFKLLNHILVKYYQLKVKW